MNDVRPGDRSPGTVDPVLLVAFCPAGDRGGRNVIAAAVRAVVAQVLRVGVVEVECQAVVHALVEDDLQGVVAEVAHVAIGIADAASTAGKA